MLILSGTTDTLQVVTATAVACLVNASYVDLTTSSGATLPGRPANIAISTATTTTVVSAPGAGVVRNVKNLSVYNNGAASVQISVQHNDGTTSAIKHKVTLQIGEALCYEEHEGWYVMDAAGGVKTAPATGRLVKTTVLTTGTSFTTGPSTNTIKVRVQGGGGGGGGCTSLASAASAAGGGGSGAYAEKLFAVSPNTAYAYTIGTAGAGASGALGGNGGSSTFVVNGVTVTTPGGTGAPVATAATTVTAYAGGAGAAIATNGDVNLAGEPGNPGMCILVATPIVASGPGGNSLLGSGGLGLAVVGAGNAANGFGAGGGGAATGASTVRTGGNGTAGCIIVDEYT